jgi:hypothetical protein
MVEIKQGEADVTEREELTLDGRPQNGAVYPPADARDGYMAKSTRHVRARLCRRPSRPHRRERSKGAQCRFARFGAAR